MNPRHVIERLSDIVFVASVAAREEVVQDEVGDVATEPMPARQVAAEVHARENAALRGFTPQPPRSSRTSAPRQVALRRSRRSRDGLA